MAETKRVQLTWEHDLVFRGEGAGKAPITLDGDNVAGPGPMENLLLALAACSGSDVVVILKKKRADLRSLRVEVAGERREEIPERYTAITITYHIAAPSLAEAQARHTIELSLEKYCSVAHSLAPDVAVRYELALQA
ncbi:MAG: OsmC family protein [Gemmatimonadales bacterium]|nr:OsmC family protein [Gemmatimonadales bacterium]